MFKLVGRKAKKKTPKLGELLHQAIEKKKKEMKEAKKKQNSYLSSKLIKLN
jgi:hypothetical protein